MQHTQCILIRTLLLLILLANIYCIKISAQKPPVQRGALTKSAIGYFTWNTELCTNKGTYNTQQFTKVQLQNTYELCYAYNGILLEEDGVVLKKENLPKLDLNKLTAEYQQKLTMFTQMEVVNTPYWQNIQQQKIKELTDEYDLKRLTLLSYNNSAVLLDNRFSSICPDIIKVLNTKDTAALMQFWKAFSEKESTKNGSPQEYMRRFYEKYHSADRVAYAKIELTAYGWWNAVNDQLVHITIDNKMIKQFNQLFIKKISKCDEP